MVTTGFLQLKQLLFAVLLDLQGFGAQGVLHPAIAVLGHCFT